MRIILATITHLGQTIDSHAMISTFQGRSISDLVWSTVAHVVGWDPYDLHDLLQHMLSGLDLYYADPGQPLTTAGEELDHVDHDVSEVCTIISTSRVIGTDTGTRTGKDKPLNIMQSNIF